MSDLTFVKIKSIKRSRQRPVYDIQVKKNHNFFANGLLVHNCLIFQEDVMNLANKVAGFPLAETDEVRRAIMKRSISGGEAAKKKMKDLEDSFVAGCIKNGVQENTAKIAYETICRMSGYGFNRTCHSLQLVNKYVSNDRIKKTIPIKDIEPGDLVMSRDESTGKDVLVTVIAKHDHGVLDLVEVELTTGERVKCTWDHKFRTIETKEMLPLHEIVKQGLSITVNHTEFSAVLVAE